MNPLPDPQWPVVLLALVQLVDAALSRKPVAFVRDCLTDVHFPQRYWWVLTPLKVCAAAGLVAGLWIPQLALVTTVALVAYFVVAIGAHVRARDFGRALFVNACGMLVISAGTLYLSFVR